jgi:magnesium and cobalt exporter, CNNM family
MQDLSRQLAGAQLGITMASLALGFVGEPALGHLIEDLLGGVDLPERLVTTIGFVLALGIVSFLHMVIGEMVPKNLSIAGAERMLLRLARPMRAFTRLFAPVIVSLNALANLTLRLLRVEPTDELAVAVTPEELASMFAESRAEGLLDEEVHGLLSRALGYSRITADEVMSPLASRPSVSRLTPVSEVEAVSAASGASRLPVRSPDGSTFAGFVHVKDLLDLDPGLAGRPVPMDRIRPMIRFRPDATLPDMLVAMRRARTYLAFVAEPEGHPLGLVELDDVLDPLVAESS